MRYIRIPFNLIDDTFYEVLSTKEIKPEIIHTDMKMSKCEEVTQYTLVKGKGMCRIFYCNIPEKSKLESDVELLERGVKDAKCCVACRQLKEFGREKYENNIRRSK